MLIHRKTLKNPNEKKTKISQSHFIKQMVGVSLPECVDQSSAGENDGERAPFSDELLR